MRGSLIITGVCMLFSVQYGCKQVDSRLITAENFLHHQVDSASNHLLIFSNFKKVDGIEKQKESLIYEMTFQGFVSAVKDCYWDGNIISSYSKSSLAKSLYGSNWGIGKKDLSAMKIYSSKNEFSLNESNSLRFLTYKKGDGHFVKGLIVFEKRDSGWQIIEMDIKHDDEAGNSYKDKSDSLAISKSVQTNNSKSALIVKNYGGIYEASQNKSIYGIISIYPESENKILFYVELAHGAPSYSSGSLYGRVEMINGIGTFYSKHEDDETGCKLNFNYNNKELTIKTIEPDGNCSFGNGVSADGVYIKKSNVIPDHFEDIEGTKVYFKSTKPEKYNN